MIENCNLILKQKIECLIFQYVNPAFERLTGFRKSEILGSPTDNLLNEDKTATVSLSALSLLCKKSVLLVLPGYRLHRISDADRYNLLMRFYSLD